MLGQLLKKNTVVQSKHRIQPQHTSSIPGVMERALNLDNRILAHVRCMTSCKYLPVSVVLVEGRSALSKGKEFPEMRTGGWGSVVWFIYDVQLRAFPS